MAKEESKKKVVALISFFNDAIGRTVGKNLITEVPVKDFKALSQKGIVKEATKADVDAAKKYQNDYILEMNARRGGKTMVSGGSEGKEK